MLSVSHPIIQRAAFAYQHVVEENKNDMVQKPHLLVEKEQHNGTLKPLCLCTEW